MPSRPGPSGRASTCSSQARRSKSVTASSQTQPMAGVGCGRIAPSLVGGQSLRIATGPGQVLTGMRCAHILTDDAGYLYTRYVKNA